MKVYRNVVLMIAALVFAGVSASLAKAQEVVVQDAHFTLPFPAMWADTILPPGHYTLSVVRRAEDRGMLYSVTFAGEDRKKTILALSPLGPRVGQRSMLVVESRGETHSIRAMHLANADLVLTFPEPKAQRELVAKGPETIQSVPILVATK
jgi:hypothetical protein